MNQLSQLFLQIALTIYPWCLNTDGNKISHTHHMSRIR